VRSIVSCVRRAFVCELNAAFSASHACLAEGLPDTVTRWWGLIPRMIRDSAFSSFSFQSARSVGCSAWLGASGLASVVHSPLDVRNARKVMLQVGYSRSSLSGFIVEPSPTGSAMILIWSDPAWSGLIGPSAEAPRYRACCLFRVRPGVVVGLREHACQVRSVAGDR